jgi:hypothetical protein
LENLCLSGFVAICLGINELKKFMTGVGGPTKIDEEVITDETI